MSVKDQVLDSNEISIRISNLYQLLSTAEDIHEILGEPPTTDLKFIYASNSLNDEEKNNYPLYRVGRGKYPYYVLYDTIKDEYVKFLKDVMLKYSQKTMETRVEYINFILEDGRFAIFEGDIDKVSIPMPKGIASSHTHPGVCIFSHIDINTVDDLFTKGYVVIAVMNPACVSIFYRRGVYTEYDQQELRRLYSKVKKAKTLEELKDVYLNFRAENVIFTSYLIS